MATELRGDAIEPQLAQFQRIDEHIDRTNRIAPIHPIIKAARPRCSLLADSVAKVFLSHRSQIFRAVGAAIEY
jgi:hypothetical protein